MSSFEASESAMSTYDEILNKSVDADKYTDTAGRDAIRQIVQWLDDTGVYIPTDDREHFARLLATFAPKTTGKPKSPESWVARARAKKDVRYFLSYIHVEDGYAVATDGNRMHKAETSLADGWYMPTGEPVPDGTIPKGQKYPDTRQFFEPARYQHVLYEFALGERRHVPKAGESVRVGDYEYQMKYIREALGGEKAPFKTWVNDVGQMLMIFDRRQALVCPLRED